MTPFGSAVVPEVNRISQMSSEWISTSGSEALRSERLLSPGPQFGVHDGQLRLDQVDHGLYEVRCHHRVQRRGDEAGLGDADLGHVGLDRVLAEQQDYVAAFQAAGQQRVR